MTNARHQEKHIIFNWHGAPQNREMVEDLYWEGLKKKSKEQLVAILLDSNGEYLLEYRYFTAEVLELELIEECWCLYRLDYACFQYEEYVIKIGKRK